MVTGFKAWSELTDEEAARVVQDLGDLGHDIGGSPREQARVHVDPAGAVYLAVHSAKNEILQHQLQVDGTGESFPGFLDTTVRLYPAAEAIALLKDPERSPEVELERRRALRAKRDAERQVLRLEEEAKAAAARAAENEQRRVYATCGGEAWDGLEAWVAAGYMVVLGLEDEAAARVAAGNDVEADILGTVARVQRNVLRDARVRSSSVGSARAKPPFPQREWRVGPNESAPPREPDRSSHGAWVVAPPPRNTDPTVEAQPAAAAAELHEEAAYSPFPRMRRRVPA